MTNMFYFNIMPADPLKCCPLGLCTINVHIKNRFLLVTQNNIWKIVHAWVQLPFMLSLSAFTLSSVALYLRF